LIVVEKSPADSANNSGEQADADEDHTKIVRQRRGPSTIYGPPEVGRARLGQRWTMSPDAVAPVVFENVVRGRFEAQQRIGHAALDAHDDD